MSAVVSPPAEAAPEAGPPKTQPSQHSPKADATIAAITERPGAYDLFQAMRRIEASHPELPLLGDALRRARSRSALHKSRR